MHARRRMQTSPRRRPRLRLEHDLDGLGAEREGASRRRRRSARWSVWKGKAGSSRRTERGTHGKGRGSAAFRVLRLGGLASRAASLCSCCTRRSTNSNLASDTHYTTQPWPSHRSPACSGSTYAHLSSPLQVPLLGLIPAHHGRSTGAHPHHLRDRRRCHRWIRLLASRIAASEPGWRPS